MEEEKPTYGSATCSGGKGDVSEENGDDVSEENHDEQHQRLR